MIVERVKRYLRLLVGVRRGWLVYHGTRVYFPQGSCAAQSILLSGTYEYAIQAILMSASRDGAHIFDVGANIGVSAIPLLGRKNSCHVVSIEASPSVLPFLEKTHSKSPHRKRWEIVSKAATERYGENVSFTVHQSGGDVFDGIKHTGRMDFAANITVPTTTIDAEWELRHRPEVSLIKVDTEGAEIGVLKGSLKCISACRPTIITEWCPKNFIAYGNSPEQMWNLAKELDYDVFAIPSMAPILTSKVLPSLLELQENLLLISR